jgi:hypothetical protein
MVAARISSLLALLTRRAASRYKGRRLDGSTDLHVLLLLLLRAPDEPLRQWFACVPIDDHILI